MGKRVVVIGAGYGGLASAALLADRGYEVTLVEKNGGPGGRGRGWESGGFTFDMGPSWYLMPDVFERFFGLLGAKREDYWELTKLSTYYQVFFGDGAKVRITDNFEETRASFEGLERGAAGKLDSYLAGAKYKYDTAIGEFLYRDYSNIFQFFNRRLMVEGIKLGVFSRLDSFVRKTFQDERVRQLLEYSMVFLGSSPTNAPALYSLLAHVDLGLGVWFPKGGMVSLATGLERLAKERGAKVVYDSPVRRIILRGGRAVGVETAEGEIPADLVVANADYAHVELDLLDAEHRSYPERWWKRATVAPSMLVGFLGSRRRIEGLEHHNLYFASNWDRHFDAIFRKPAWPSDPCFYASATTRTEPSMAPPGGENLYLLVPIATELDDSDEAREALFDKATGKLESLVGSAIRDDLAVKRIYSQRDFKRDFNARDGSALGLSHTLFQTAIFRPSRRSKKVKGLYYAGQYTHPGIGVPMALIAAELVVKAIADDEAG